MDRESACCPRCCVDFPLGGVSARLPCHLLSSTLASWASSSGLQVLWWKHVESEYAAEVAAQADVFGGEDGQKRQAGEPPAQHAAAPSAGPCQRGLLCCAHRAPTTPSCLIPFPTPPFGRLALRMCALIAPFAQPAWPTKAGPPTSRQLGALTAAARAEPYLSAAAAAAPLPRVPQTSSCV